MNANIWIKTLNTRLLAEPNWAFKAGYLVLLIAASLAMAASLILRVTVSFAGIVLVQLAKPARYNETEDEVEGRATVDAVPTFYDNNVVGAYHEDYDERLTGYE